MGLTAPFNKTPMKHTHMYTRVDTAQFMVQLDVPHAPFQARFYAWYVKIYNSIDNGFKLETIQVLCLTIRQPKSGKIMIQIKNHLIE